MADSMIEQEGFDELSKRMSESDTRMKIGLNDGLRKIGRLFVSAEGSGELASATPRRTGKLARSTYFQVIQESGGQRLEINQPAKTPAGLFYGYFVREGTQPHDIYPVNAKALRFEIGGNIIFAKHVKHPGTKPNPYHKRTMEKLRPSVDGIIMSMGEYVTAYLSGEGG